MLHSLQRRCFSPGNPEAAALGCAPLELAASVLQLAGGAASSVVCTATVEGLLPDADGVFVLVRQVGHAQGFHLPLLCMFSWGRGFRHIKQGG